MEEIGGKWWRVRGLGGIWKCCDPEVGGGRFSTTPMHSSASLFRKDRVVAGEQRWHVIGMAKDAVLVVVHVYRKANADDKEETIRMIRVREANKRERRIYIQQTDE
jgi:uncharacterized DUF497 family protein